MLDAAQLRDRIAHDYPDAAQVSDTVVRFVRTANNRPYAVYYLDVGDSLPSDQESLTRYQDGIIGKHYFEGKKSLQWSNYLYFITTRQRLASNEIRKTLKLIEADRSYARKFVIAEDELETLLSPPTPIAPSTNQLPNILGVWTKSLVQLGLENAVFSEADNPTRMAAIEATIDRPPSAAPKATPASATRPEPPPFIRGLTLSKYRSHPTRQQFDFGAVNLIVGPNAAGKTSLLEAIELFYCGRNKRSADANPKYELVARLSNGNTETATSDRKKQPPQIFRDRNLAWYGQLEVKTNDLYRSFARYNFLDTDAAVHLSDTPFDIENDLAKLLVGPDAATAWRNMERVSKAIDDKLRELAKDAKFIEDERGPLGQRIEAAAKIKIDSAPLDEQLDALLNRLGWKAAQADLKKSGPSKLLSRLAELAALSSQATAMIWVPSPISIKALQEYVAATTKLVSEAEKAKRDLEGWLSVRRDLDASIARLSAAHEVAKKVQRIAEADVPGIERQSRSSQQQLAKMTNRLASMDDVALVLRSQSSSSTLLEASYKAATARRLESERALQQARSELSRFNALRERSISLALQLRQIAADIVKSSSKPDECPLCHTEFPPGQLAAHMSLGVDAHLESASENLATGVRNYESASAEARSLEQALNKLREYWAYERTADTTVKDALAAVAAAQHALISTRTQVDDLASRTRALREQGLSTEELNRNISRLGELGYPLGEPSAKAISALVAKMDEELKRLQSQLEVNARGVNQSALAMQALLPVHDQTLTGYNNALSLMKENLAASKAALDGLLRTTKSYPWPSELALAELSVSVNSLRSIAGDLQGSLAREQEAKALSAGAAARKAELDRLAADVAKKTRHFNTAGEKLKALMAEQSLTAGMESALKQNRSAIETIFAKIHAPPEFSGLGEKLGTLVRKTGGQATLKEISTGQRAAFALSIFLAQNSKLVSAPPCMLIDDPIAHVDDLNALSFLDYLREVTLQETRQIFFATANDKIATLFERKFDFMGDEFRKIQLSRDM